MTSGVAKVPEHVNPEGGAASARAPPPSETAIAAAAHAVSALDVAFILALVVLPAPGMLAHSTWFRPPASAVERRAASVVQESTIGRWQGCCRSPRPRHPRPPRTAG